MSVCPRSTPLAYPRFWCWATTIGSVHPGSVDPPGVNSNRLPLTVLRPGNQIDQGVVIHSGSLRREPREPTEPLSPKTDGEYRRLETVWGRLSGELVRNHPEPSCSLLKNGFACQQWKMVIIPHAQHAPPRYWPKYNQSTVDYFTGPKNTWNYPEKNDRCFRLIWSR